MDIISHGLWGGIALGRKNKKDYWLAFGFGVLPDLLSFGVHTVAMVLGLETVLPETMVVNGQRFHQVPAYVHTLYDWTHSLVIFALVFGLVWLIRRRPLWVMGAWALHILVDIPTHAESFFPTPFLWPLSSFHVSGINWGSPIIFFPNWALIFLAYGFWCFSGKNKNLKKSPK